MPVMSIIRRRQGWKKPSQIDNILDKLKLYKHHETGQYSKIDKRIHITGKGILNWAHIVSNPTESSELLWKVWSDWSINVNFKNLDQITKLPYGKTNNCLVQHYQNAWKIGACFVD